MADRARNQNGFTLAEMLVALGILTVGLTALLASLGDSVALRRSTDMRLAAAQAVEDVLFQVRQTGIKRRGDAETDLDLELALDGPIDVPGRPGLRFFVTAEEHAERADLWLLHLQARWLEAGEFLTEDFYRVVPRQLPLGVRVERFRDETTGTPR